MHQVKWHSKSQVGHSKLHVKNKNTEQPSKNSRNTKQRSRGKLHSVQIKPAIEPMIMPASYFSLLTHAFLFLLAIFFCIPHFSHSHCTTSPIIFNFGDSNSDTGGLFAGLGYPVNLPNGRTFFRRSTGRLSDGRLLIDFLCNFLLFIFLLFLYYLVNFGS